MPDQITESESIPPVRVAEFPQGQLALQSPEGWIYQRIDGKDVYPNANQQPVTNYYDPYIHATGELCINFSGEAVAVDKVPVWDWEGTNLAAKHFRPVPTSEPVPSVSNYAPTETTILPLNHNREMRELLGIANGNLDRIATALEGILADLTKGNDADKG